jgi:hypothetical protein
VVKPGHDFFIQRDETLIRISKLYTMYHIGQKVVCIYDSIMPGRHAETAAREIEMPVEGVIYTVRGLPVWRNIKGMLLEEIRNPKQYFGDEFCEPGFLLERFRPLTNVELLVISASEGTLVPNVQEV